jgi:hypothetical protein
MAAFDDDLDLNEIIDSAKDDADLDLDKIIEENFGENDYDESADLTEIEADMYYDECTQWVSNNIYITNCLYLSAYLSALCIYLLV